MINKILKKEKMPGYRFVNNDEKVSLKSRNQIEKSMNDFISDITTVMEKYMNDDHHFVVTLILASVPEFRVLSNTCIPCAESMLETIIEVEELVHDDEVH